jgi:uncharacterized protein YndB with AHSA1/START domain
MTPRDQNHPRESIEVEVEVAGTPEQAWEAIATGPGIEAWFVPAEVDERPGGDLSFDMGGGLEFAGKVTAWDRPHRFAYEEDDWAPYENAPPARLATEWLVEARSGGASVVRVVNSVFSDAEADWNEELEQMREGWSVYLHNLRLYLERFPGERCATIMVNVKAPGTQDEAWATLTAGLGLPDPVAEGDHVTASAAGAPLLAGVVERSGRAAHHRELMLRIDAPAPGVAILFTYGWHDQVYANFHAYLFGDGAPEAAERAGDAWRTWMDARFPAAQLEGERSGQ